MENMQLRALNRWEFEENQDGIYITQIDNMKIGWSIKGQCGAYTIDSELGLIKDWEHLDEIMQQTAIY